MSESTQLLDALRAEFEGADGSFLLKLRVDLMWDETSFAYLTGLMRRYVEGRAPDDDIPRWIAEGFWYLDVFVADWSSHPNFRARNPHITYDEHYETLRALAGWLFMGEPLFEREPE